MHQLYLRSLQKQQLADSTTPPPSTTTQQQQESSVHNALEGNANIPLVMWMDKTRFSNTQFMHRQDRNIHGKIFGGHIMQQAFELAWVAATCFLGPNQAQFMFVGDIQFVRPVNIGKASCSPACFSFLALLFAVNVQVLYWSSPQEWYTVITIEKEED